MLSIYVWFTLACYINTCTQEWQLNVYISMRLHHEKYHNSEKRPESWTFHGVQIMPEYQLFDSQWPHFMHLSNFMKMHCRSNSSAIISHGYNNNKTSHIQHFLKNWRPRNRSTLDKCTCSVTEASCAGSCKLSRTAIYVGSGMLVSSMTLATFQRVACKTPWIHPKG